MPKRKQAPEGGDGAPSKRAKKNKDENDPNTWTVPEIKEELKKLGFSTAGKKADLVTRLQDAKDGKIEPKPAAKAKKPAAPRKNQTRAARGKKKEEDEEEEDVEDDDNEDEEDDKPAPPPAAKPAAAKPAPPPAEEEEEDDEPEEDEEDAGDE